MSCIKPCAPLGETARGLLALSARITLAMKSASILLRELASLMMARSDVHGEGFVHFESWPTRPQVAAWRRGLKAIRIGGLYAFRASALESGAPFQVTLEFNIRRLCFPASSGIRI
jgi:hypothetical protein